MNLKPVILIVEDDPFMMKIVVTFITRLAGMDIMTASSGHAGLKLFEETAEAGAVKIAAILTDVNCSPGGGIDGPGMVKLIKAGKYECPPVMFMTGDPRPYSVDYLTDLSSGNVVMLKPFMSSELMAGLDMIIPPTAARLAGQPAQVI